LSDVQNVVVDKDVPEMHVAVENPSVFGILKNVEDTA
jgi:acetyltransferase-like isoleucine patch superfamily enzyme